MFHNKFCRHTVSGGCSINAVGYWRLFTLILCSIFSTSLVRAQTPEISKKGDTKQSADTAHNVVIDLTANTAVHLKTDTLEYDKFIGNAVFIQGPDTLYCDSLYKNTVSKMIEAFGDVRLRQSDGTHAESRYLRYTPDKKLAYMHENVTLTDGNNNLKTQDLTYDLGTKTGTYDNGGVLKTDSTIVNSVQGEYFVREKRARFRKKVVITDVRYHIVSEDLGYNTENKVVTLYAESVVTTDSGKSQLRSADGTYDSRTGEAHFRGHSSAINAEHFLEGDSLFYNKITGYGFALGHVISIDTVHHSRLFCDRVEYYKLKRTMWATGKPVLEQVNKKDTFWMRADTFYSYPEPNYKSPSLTIRMTQTHTTPVRKSLFERGYFLWDKVDTSDEEPIVHAKWNLWFFGLGAPIPPPEKKYILTNGEKTDLFTTVSALNAPVEAEPRADTGKLAKKNNVAKGNPKKKAISGKKDDIPGKDTVAADTTAPLIFIGYHHVRIFSDSMQGKCDSVSYSQMDSTIRMMYNPITWSHMSQVTGDTILLTMNDSGKLKNMYVPNNAFVVSQSGPEKAQLFDQIQGKTLTAFFEKNAINHIIVVPDAQAIYYSKDGKGAYVGESESKSDKMTIFFINQQIDKIIFENDITQTLTPLEKVNIAEARLGRFKWLNKERPKTKGELFE